MDLLVPQRLASSDLRTSESFDCEDGFGYGRFQKRMLFLIFMGAFSVECQTLVVSLVTGDVDHWCKPPIDLNISAADWKNVAIPIEADGSFSSCRVYERCKTPTHLRDSDDYQKDDSAPAETGWWYNRCFNVSELQDANDNRDALCDAWDYDPNTAETSAISSWNLVCDRRWAPAGLVTLQNIGAVVALIVIGAFVDYVSRSAVLLGSYAAVAISTVCSFSATDYAFYAVARFSAGASVAVHTVFTILIPFEFMTHAHRPQQVLFLAILGLVSGEMWTVVVRLVAVDWRLKQLIFLAPTALLLAALATAQESPRWLIAKGRLDEAEAVMMEAAKANKFQLALTACLVEKLREHTDNRVYQEYDNREEDLLDARSLRRRALVMCGVCFSISFVFHVGALSTVEYNEFWIVCFTVIVTLLTYVVMHFLIAGVTLVMVLSTCFLLAGCIQCALSVAVGTGPGMATKILLVLSKGVSDVILVHCFTYVLELFPSAVRAGVACWAFACGRVAAICAVVILVLRPVGHEDVFFAVTGLVLFVTLLFIRALPRTTVVEEARIVARRASASSRIAMQHMKRTLERRTPNDLSAVHSRDSSVSMSRKGRRSVGNISPRSSYTSRRSGSARAPQ
ncbi:hypothetical protein HPB51_024122 [Rhipicephalus microplus]|uniref:Uncharacterized protein n=1 Tax=Rhipicephalus microplus TaxID=6941 RepID=A0A9J6EDG2_RHIMP|nr:solute carrier family 22 member 7-like [Rhipicephalus microplus]KAH8032345.1 hypothetical protein HPB51_024122 [Rhipicephalus microplus]